MSLLYVAAWIAFLYAVMAAGHAVDRHYANAMRATLARVHAHLGSEPVAFPGEPDRRAER